MADYFFMEPPGSLPPAAKLGLVLEEVTGEKHLLITGLSPHGKAGEAGLREKDILLAINGQPVYTMSDVRIAMIDTRQGDTITVKIRRSNASQQEQEMEFSVIARTLSGGKPHP
jgi:S1-C subfamily serine protease